mmetsp:Transcript_43644/g.117718  ORF Transcript_43644/g.117718 Transcript_43644/m.117718 type:complete len:245 (-) Transcript_43644:86-820(-)
MQALRSWGFAMASGKLRCCTRREQSRPKFSRITNGGEPWMTEQMHAAAPICTHLLCSPRAPNSGFSSVAKTGEPSTSSTRERARRKTVSAQASLRCKSASCNRVTTTCRMRCSKGTTASPCSSASSPKSFTLSHRPSGFKFAPASPMQLMTIGNQSRSSVWRNSRISSIPLRCVSWSLRRLSANSNLVLSSAKAWLLSRKPKTRLLVLPLVVDLKDGASPAAGDMLTAPFAAARSATRPEAADL